VSPRWTRREFTSTLATLELGAALPGFPKPGEAIWARLGDGIVNYHYLLKALCADEYEGVISLETHCRRPDGDASRTFAVENYFG
jgi:sugar phosphate isomerase/epimerase